jgi:hypothetical protein
MHFFTEQVPPVEERSCYHAVNYTALPITPQKTTYTLVHQIIHSTKFLVSKILVLNLTKIIGVTDMVHGLIFKDTTLYMLYTLHEQYRQWNFD